MLKLVVYIFFFSFSSVLNAQSTFQLVIEKNDSTSPNFISQSITEVNTGEIYAVGTIYPYGGFSEIRLVKLNKEGTVQWDTTYGITETPVAYQNAYEFFPEIMPAHDGGVIVSCHSYSHAIDQKEENNILVWKINEKGEIEWQKTLSVLQFTDMFSTEDGGYLFLGYIHEQSSFQTDMIVYKTDKNGNVIWSRYLGDQYKSERAYSIVEINDLIYVCGYQSPNGWSDLGGILYALDSNGENLWSIFTPPTEDNPKVIINSVFQFNNEYYFNDIGMSQFDPKTGEFWNVPDSMRIGFTDKGYDFDIFCGGEDQMNVVNLMADGYYLRKYKDLVEPFYEKKITGVSATLNEMIRTIDNGFLILTGYGQSMQITKTDCMGNVDHWSEACNSKIPLGQEFLIYPNPSENEIQIDASFDFNGVTLFSVNGSKVKFTNSCDCPRQTIDVSELSSGVYIVKINGVENQAISKFIKL